MEIDAMMRMMATTIKSSIREKPFLLPCIELYPEAGRRASTSEGPAHSWTPPELTPCAHRAATGAKSAPS